MQFLVEEALRVKLEQHEYAAEDAAHRRRALQGAQKRTDAQLAQFRKPQGAA